MDALSGGLRILAERLHETETKAAAALRQGPASGMFTALIEHFPSGSEGILLAGREAFTRFDAALDAFFPGLPGLILETQKEERFSPAPSDAVFIRYGKRIKQAVRLLRKRMHLGGEKWTHKVPFRLAAVRFYKGKLSDRLLSFLEEILGILLESEAALIEQITEGNNNGPEHPGFREFSGKITRIIQEAGGTLRRLTGEITNDFQSALDRLGTFELPRRRYSAAGVQRQTLAGKRRREKRLGRWENTSRAAGDRRRYNLELSRLTSENGELFDSFSAELDNKIEDSLGPILIRTRQKTLSLMDAVNAAAANGEVMADVLAEQRARAQNDLLEEEVTRLAEAVAEQAFPLFMDRILNGLKAPFEKLSRKLLMTTEKTLAIPLSARDLESFSPYDLVTFDTLPRILKVMSENRILFFESLQTLLAGARDFCNVIVYNLEAGLAAHADGDAAAAGIAGEGVERALRGFDETTGRFRGSTDAFKTGISDMLLDISGQLRVLMGIHRIIEIRLRIQSALVKERGREIRRKAAGLVRELLPKVVSFIVASAKKVSGSYRVYRKRLGLSAEKVIVSSHIADFLAETKIALEKLPFVYQRLYASLPLAEQRFFMERPEETTALAAAFENWGKRRFAAAVLVAEKGSGVTTFINLSLKTIPLRIPVIRLEIPEGTTTEAETVRLLCDGFTAGGMRLTGNKPIKTFEDFTDRINAMPGRCMAVVENIQQMFLRVIGGSGCVRGFLRMVSATNGNVFWLLSCTLYAWEYFDKIFSAGDMIAYVIKLQRFSQKQLEDIIMLRHRMSGFTLRFEPPSAVVRTIRYRRLSKEKREEWAKQEYFRQLYSYTRSNVRLSLLYWLRSARDVTRDTITIGAMEDLDFSFLSSLAGHKQFLLYELLLHDGLRLTEAESVFRQSPETI
ncbi:MAG: hypothetical protein E4H36_13120, partial [Spirochaetales bacterium]